MGWRDRVAFSDLVGQTLTDVFVKDDEILFTTEQHQYKMYHSQDCCESVYVESITGDISDILNSVVMIAEEASNVDIPALSEYPDSYTWTFYKIETAKGGITIRWYGSSNGYYSESVDFEKVNSDYN